MNEAAIQRKAEYERASEQLNAAFAAQRVANAQRHGSSSPWKYTDMRYRDSGLVIGLREELLAVCEAMSAIADDLQRDCRGMSRWEMKEFDDLAKEYESLCLAVQMAERQCR